MRSMTFLIVHYTVHIPRWGKFTTGGVITDRRKLLSLVSQQSAIFFFHCTVCITIMAKFTNYWLDDGRKSDRNMLPLNWNT